MLDKGSLYLFSPPVCLWQKNYHYAVDKKKSGPKYHLEFFHAVYIKLYLNVTKNCDSSSFYLCPMNLSLFH